MERRVLIVLWTALAAAAFVTATPVTPTVVQKSEYGTPCRYCRAILDAKKQPSEHPTYAPVSVASIVREGCHGMGSDEESCLKFAREFVTVLTNGMRNEDLSTEVYCEAMYFCSAEPFENQNILFGAICNFCQRQVQACAQQVASQTSISQTIKSVQRLCRVIAVFKDRQDCFRDMMRRSFRIGTKAAAHPISPKLICRIYGPCAVPFTKSEDIPWLEAPVGTSDIEALFSLVPGLSEFLPEWPQWSEILPGVSWGEILPSLSLPGWSEILPVPLTEVTPAVSTAIEIGTSLAPEIVPVVSTVAEVVASIVPELPSASSVGEAVSSLLPTVSEVGEVAASLIPELVPGVSELPPLSEIPEVIEEHVASLVPELVPGVSELPEVSEIPEFVASLVPKIISSVLPLPSMSSLPSVPSWFGPSSEVSTSPEAAAVETATETEPPAEERVVETAKPEKETETAPEELAAVVETHEAVTAPEEPSTVPETVETEAASETKGEAETETKQPVEVKEEESTEVTAEGEVTLEEDPQVARAKTKAERAAVRRKRRQQEKAKAKKEEEEEEEVTIELPEQLTPLLSAAASFVPTLPTTSGFPTWGSIFGSPAPSPPSSNRERKLVPPA